MICFKSVHYGARVLAIFIDKVKPHHRGRKISAEITATSSDKVCCAIKHCTEMPSITESHLWVESNPLQAAAAPFLLSKMISNGTNDFWSLASVFASDSVQCPEVLSVQQRASKAMDVLSVPLRGRTRQRRCCNSWMNMGLCQDKYFMLEEGDASVLGILLWRWDAPFHDSVTIPHSCF